MILETCVEAEVNDTLASPYDQCAHSTDIADPEENLGCVVTDTEERQSTESTGRRNTSIGNTPPLVAKELESFAIQSSTVKNTSTGVKEGVAS